MLKVDGLYLHVPFCRGKCRYCDFYSVPINAPAAADAYVKAAAIELASLAPCLRRPLRSVYVGGGTPTVLGPHLLKELLSLARPHLGAGTEFSVEANPGTVDAAVAAALAEGGVNRVTLGVQSFDERGLALLGRIHTARQVEQAAALLRQAGIANIALDLIYGIPGQALQTWRTGLKRAIALAPSHVSTYALSFEQGTPLRADLDAGRVAELDEELQKELYYAAIDALASAALEHYEISNFAMAGKRCAHNMIYWHNEGYLGIGPSAASYVEGVRRTNRADLSGYVAAIRAGRPPAATSETLALRQCMGETLMLGLRLIEGVHRRSFRNRFGSDPLEAFPNSIERHRGLGSLLVTDSHVRLSRDYLFVSDSVLADILAEA